jgi:hypothetical protein
VTDNRDQIDTWLEHDITPLMPRQGALDRIRRTARRRKATQAVLAGAGCAVVIAAAAVVPQLAHSHASPAAGYTTTPAAQGRTGAPSNAPTRRPDRPKPRGSASKAAGGTSLTNPGPVPAIFDPTSVTFVGTGPPSNGVIGAVIGQARNSQHRCATQYCTSLATTSNYGQTWSGVSAPLTGPPDGAKGVSQLRFANTDDGWAYGPALFETTDGGLHWSREATFGQRVVALEAGKVRAFAIFARCAGASADFAQDCTSFALYTSVNGSATWTPAAVGSAFRTMRTDVPSSASLTLTNTTGYLLGPAGELLRGNLTGGTWTHVGQAACEPGGAQASGLPLNAHLATLGTPQTTSPTLVLACNGNGDATIYTSATGRAWVKAAVVNIAGQATSLSSDQAGHLVLATSADIYYSADQGVTWQEARLTGGPPRRGFSYIGMTTAAQGVAVPADAALGEVFVTSDGGLTWLPYLISR